MASIRKYKTAKGSRWRVQYRSPDGKSRTKQPFPTKAAAERWAAKNTIDIADGGWINPNHGRTTVNTVGARWLSMQTHLKPSTYRVVDQSWRVHVQPAWGSMQIGAIRPSAIQSWVSGIDKSASTIRKAHNCLYQVLQTAVDDGLIKTNPAARTRLPRKAKAAHVYLTMSQLQALADECSCNREIVWTLGTVGLRWGELAALRVQDVDFLRKRFMVERNAVTVGSEVHVGTPKTHERRSVAVPEFILQMIAPLCEGKARGDLIWPRPSDGDFRRVPGHNTWYYGALNRVRDADPNFPRVTIHGLRHVAAGLMVSQGANVLAVARQLGHADPSMTLRTYADLFDSDLDAVAGRMEESFSDVVRLSCGSDK